MPLMNPTQPTERSARLVVTPHPLTTQGQTSLAIIMRDGETLLELLERHRVTTAWVVEVGGLRVPAMMWPRTRVHHGQVIECRPVAQQDAGSALRLVAFAVLAYYTMGAGNGWLAASTGLAANSVGLAIAGAVVFAAGAMVINKVLPPNLADGSGMEPYVNTTEPTYSLSGGRNQARLWQPMALVLGQPYVVPDLAAQPYTYFGGEDQFLVQQFHAGINCQAVGTIRIGQTAIADYQDITLSSCGLPGNTYTNPLPSNNVDSIAGGLLDAPSGTGPWVTRTTSVGTAQIGIDLEASLFGVNSTNGAYEGRTVVVDVQYAVAGSGAWVDVQTNTTYQAPVETFVTDPETNTTARVVTYVTTAYPAGRAGYTNASAKPVRAQIKFAVPSGQYDVRLRKVSVNETSTSAQNTITWTQLKSFQANTTSFPGQGILGLVIKASGQLSGAIDDLNWIATAKPMPYWNGTAWVTATNRSNGLSNPGAQILQIARGIFDENNKLIAGLGWADSRIDIDSLKRFMVWCAAKSFTFDTVIQQAMSIDDLMQTIAYAGMGTISWNDGKLGVQWLDNAAVIEGVINMGNIKAQSFSVQYDTNDRADEIEYGYFDRAQNNQWNSLRVLAPGVTMPRSTARLSNAGITTEAHASMLARHAMAQNIYMNKSITFDQDLEHMTYRRGTVLALSHDMTQWGYSGRVQAASEVGGYVVLTLDDTIPATGPTGAANRYIGLRLLGETSYRIFGVQAFTGTARTVTLSGSWPAGVPLPGAGGSAGSNAMDALWVYDFKPTPGLKVMVAKVEPAEGFGSARVTVVPVPDEFWPFVLTGSYTPPPNRSLLQTLPVASNVRVFEQLKRQGNTYTVDLSVTFDVTGNFDRAEVWGALNGSTLALLGMATGRGFEWVGGLGETWVFEVRPKNSLGALGTVASATYAVAGLSVPPSNVAGLAVAIGQTSIRATWSPSTDVDYGTTVIRQGTSWDSGTEVARGERADALGWRTTGTYTFWAKHFDTTGNASATATSATLTVTAPAAVTGLALVAGTTGLQASWAMPALAATAQPVDRVELSFSSNFATVIDASKTTTATLPWRSPGLVELFVRAVDVAGNAGTAASVSLTVRSPSAPVALASVVSNSGVVATWSAPAVASDQQPLAGVQLSWMADFSALIDTRSTNSVELGWLSAGARTLYARYTDAAGNSGAAASVAVTVAAPSAPASLTLGFGTASIEASWSAPAIGATQQLLDRVELSWGSAFTTVVDGKKATTTTFGWLTAGNYTLYARYVDMAGNVSAVSTAALQVLAPAQPNMTAVETQINAVTLRWQDAKTSQPIKKYAIWYADAGTVFGSATLYGSAGADSRSDVLFFRSSGSKVAFLVAEDVAGNQSTPRQIDISVTMPNNFVLATEYYEDWQSSELTNGTIVNGSTGQIILPANDGRTWGQRLSNNGWTTAQQKIDAGYPIVVQPVPASGKHVEQRDIGKVLASGLVRVTPTLQSSVAGYTATIRIRGSNGDTNTAWQAWLVGDAATFSNFRYIEVEYAVASDGKGFVVLDDLYVKVEISEVTEATTLTLVSTDAAGTPYTCTKPFLDVRTALAVALGSANIARVNCIIDDSTLPARVFVQAWDTSNARTSGTVSLLISGV